jgi:hypothetical protein
MKTDYGELHETTYLQEKGHEDGKRILNTTKTAAIKGNLHAI